MKRDYIDFHEVPERQQETHDRLENWARTLHSGPGSNAAPMFRSYRSTDVWATEPTKRPIDHADARRMGRAVAMLPERHRKAVQWAYVMRTSVLAGRKYVGATAAELAQLVVDARDMLRNRGA